jgi:hypothetical protein
MDDFKIDSVHINSGDIIYDDRVPLSNAEGSISFNDMKLKIFNFSNNRTALAQQPIRAFFQTRIQNKGLLSGELYLPLFDKNGFHTLKGSLDSMDMTAFNSSLVPSAFIKIESGIIYKGTFNLDFDNSHGEGDVSVIYDDLKIKVLRKDVEEGKKANEGLKSFIANMFLINNKNMGENAKMGEAYFERMPDKSFISFWWKTALSGIKNNIGFKSDRPSERKERKAARQSEQQLQNQ